MDSEFIDAVPEQLLSAAAEVRSTVEGQPERVVLREVRDHLDREKLRSGPIARGGVEVLEMDIQRALESS